VEWFCGARKFAHGNVRRQVAESTMIQKGRRFSQVDIYQGFANLTRAGASLTGEKYSIEFVGSR
jgi:hypothetical protein